MEIARELKQRNGQQSGRYFSLCMRNTPRFGNIGEESGGLRPPSQAMAKSWCNPHIADSRFDASRFMRDILQDVPMHFLRTPLSSATWTKLP